MRTIINAFCDVTYKGKEYKKVMLDYKGVTEEEAHMYFSGNYAPVELDGDPIDVELFGNDEGDFRNDICKDNELVLWFFDMKQMEDGTWQMSKDTEDIVYDNLTLTFDDGTTETYNRPMAYENL